MYVSSLILQHISIFNFCQFSDVTCSVLAVYSNPECKHFDMDVIKV